MSARSLAALTLAWRIRCLVRPPRGTNSPVFSGFEVFPLGCGQRLLWGTRSAVPFCFIILFACVAVTLRAAPRDAKPLPPDVDYRHVHREVALLLFDGEFQQAADWCHRFSEFNPTDAEGLYFLAGAEANLGRVDQAMRTVQRALLAGLPIERFFAGPRAVFRPLVESAPFQALAERQMTSQIIHGPMVSDVTHASAKVWVRVAEEAELVLLVREARSDRYITSRRVTASSASDFTAVLKVDGLNPGTSYKYFIAAEEPRWPAGRGGEFRTSPMPDAPTKLVVAIGGGSAYKPGNERMWTVMASREPDLFLTLGDNVYIDAPTSRPYQRYKYYRRQSRPEFRELLAHTLVYSIWDDHDFGTDDCSGGAAIESPAWKREVWELFRQNWANPGFGGGDAQPGCWYHFKVGDIEFFMPDSRYYRTDPKTTPADQRTMLGPVQKKWLIETMRASTATIKVLASAVPWASGVKPGSLDPWDGFPTEREEILSTISDHKINGVILVSADRHRHEIWRIDRAGSYPLYEFESSKITNQHTHKKMEKALFSSNGLGFGLFHFDTTKPDPEIHYEVINERNEVDYEFDLKLSQLTHQ